MKLDREGIDKMDEVKKQIISAIGIIALLFLVSCQGNNQANQAPVVDFSNAEAVKKYVTSNVWNQWDGKLVFKNDGTCNWIKKNLRTEQVEYNIDGTFIINKSKFEDNGGSYWYAKVNWNKPRIIADFYTIYYGRLVEPDGVYFDSYGPVVKSWQSEGGLVLNRSKVYPSGKLIVSETSPSRLSNIPLKVPTTKTKDDEEIDLDEILREMGYGKDEDFSHFIYDFSNIIVQNTTQDFDLIFDDSLKVYHQSVNRTLKSIIEATENYFLKWTVLKDSIVSVSQSSQNLYRYNYNKFYEITRKSDGRHFQYEIAGFYEINPESGKIYKLKDETTRKINSF